ncbi:hypothetical protein LTR08_008750 [Meristemomyces frigidus]|nr:hypothetical protein LTR08_008750 [Meristemomyces frigidus]
MDSPHLAADVRPLPDIDTDDVARAAAARLRTELEAVRAALHEARMAAAHHKLQYTMLEQSSAASLERMAVEARMAQCESQVIRHAEQAAAAAVPAPSTAVHDGHIPVQKDLYQSMCREIQALKETNRYHERERAQLGRLLAAQDGEIASLGDRVTLMRARIVENRERLRQKRSRGPEPVMREFDPLSRQLDGTPRLAVYNPSAHRMPDQHQQQPQQEPFAALLQASEMVARQKDGRKKGAAGHVRNTHSLSSLPATPAGRVQKPSQQRQSTYQTPLGRQQPLKAPSTAPLPRTSALRTPGAGAVYLQAELPVSSQARQPQQQQQQQQSEGTVSASEDSEAETEILSASPPAQTVAESAASRTAARILRTSQEQREAERESVKGAGMLGGNGGSGSGMKQTKLFGTVRKAGVERGGPEPPAKKARVAASAQQQQAVVVGLGIEGVRD